MIAISITYTFTSTNTKSYITPTSNTDRDTCFDNTASATVDTNKHSNPSLHDKDINSAKQDSTTNANARAHATAYMTTNTSTSNARSTTTTNHVNTNAATHTAHKKIAIMTTDTMIASSGARMRPTISIHTMIHTRLRHLLQP